MILLINIQVLQLSWNIFKVKASKNMILRNCQVINPNFNKFYIVFFKK